FDGQGLILFATSVAGYFSDDFYEKLSEEYANRNIFFSGMSLETSLGMIYWGSKGKTSSLLITFSSTGSVAYGKYNELLTSPLDLDKWASLELATQIYVNQEKHLIALYYKQLKRFFKYKPETIDMNTPKASAEKINTWVSNQTRGKVNDFIPESAIRPDQIIILINAIYFKGQWKYEFNEKYTQDARFYVPSGKNATVQMMSVSGLFRANEFADWDAKVLELPYGNPNISMLIFLPNKIDGLAKLESQIKRFSRPLIKQAVNVNLPKFQIAMEMHLVPLLKKMGMGNIFEAPDLSDMTQEPAKVTEVLQKAFIEVNEKGTEAAKFAGCSTCSTGSRMIFTADHPFAYIIRDDEAIFFQGHFVKP
ncbi:hypothetical protein KR018_012175, partial [Drosophila ironensis]